MGMLSAFVRVFSWARLFRGLFVSTSKHRARSARGARGSNPSQKTPRQRSATTRRVTRFLRTSAERVVRIYSLEKLFWLFIAIAILCGTLSIFINKVEYFFSSVEPVVTVFIGIILVFITIQNYRKTIEHKLFISFETKYKSSFEKLWYLLNEKEKFVMHQRKILHWIGKKPSEKDFFRQDSFVKNILIVSNTYFAQIYLHNESNKVEIIKKVFLELQDGKVILLLDFGNRPCLIPPYSSKNSEKDDALEWKQIARFFEETSFYHKKNQNNSDARAYIFNNSNIFSNRKNKIIIESADEYFYVIPNSSPRNQIPGKIKKIDDNFFVKSSLENNKPIIFTKQDFFLFGFPDCVLFDDAIEELSKRVAGKITNEIIFFVNEIKRNFLILEKDKHCPLSKNNFNKNFGLCFFTDRDDKNFYVSFFFDSETETFFLPVNNEGQEMLFNLWKKSQSGNFSNFLNSTFQGCSFDLCKTTDFLIFKNKPEIIKNI